MTRLVLPVAPSDALRLFVIAGEHSGDALGAKLMAAITAAHPGPIAYAGVGAEHMEAEGLVSLYPMSEVAVMGPLAILKRLAPIVRRVYQTVDAAIAFAPHAVVIIDAPEFTHPIAKRIRARRPDIPIIDYVSPTVWAWRPGRARAMRPYVDHLLALLPFEPEAHAELGGPQCTYVGHPLIEREAAIRALSPAPLIDRLRLDPGKPVLVLLPGSRRTEVGRLLDTFRETIDVLGAAGRRLEIVMPVAASVRAMIEERIAAWPQTPHLIEAEDDKWRAFKLARAALAASGTVTLELALAGTPMAVAYKVDPVAAPFLRRMIKSKTVVLANLVLGRNAFPEFLQEDCTPQRLAETLAALIDDTPARTDQLAALAEIPARLAIPVSTPSEAAARIVLEYVERHGL